MVANPARYRAKTCKNATGSGVTLSSISKETVKAPCPLNLALNNHAINDKLLLHN